MTLDQIIAKRKAFNTGTQVTNCLAHAHLNLDQRPDKCDLCLADLRNQFRRALKVNAFLNECMDEVEQAVHDGGEDRAEG